MPRTTGTVEPEIAASPHVHSHLAVDYTQTASRRAACDAVLTWWTARQARVPPAQKLQLLTISAWTAARPGCSTLSFKRTCTAALFTQPTADNAHTNLQNDVGALGSYGEPGAPALRRYQLREFRPATRTRRIRMNWAIELRLHEPTHVQVEQVAAQHRDGVRTPSKAPKRASQGHVSLLWSAIYISEARLKRLHVSYIQRAWSSVAWYFCAGLPATHTISRGACHVDALTGPCEVGGGMVVLRSTVCATATSCHSARCVDGRTSACGTQRKTPYRQMLYSVDASINV